MVFWKKFNDPITSQYSESRTPNKRGDLRRRLKPRQSCSTSTSPEPTSVFSRIRRDRSGRLKKKGWRCVPYARRVWFDDLPPESIDSYDDLKKAYLANYLQQKKCIKVPVKTHHIKHREGESTKDFMQRNKAESMHVKGAPECMRISRFMHEITNPELIKRLHDNIPKSVDEMMRVTTAKVVFRNQQISKRRRDKFIILTISPKEILALDKGKFKAPPPMTTHVEKRNSNKFCEFHGEVGHNTDECMHLKRKIEELIKNEKLSHVIKELKQAVAKSRQAENNIKLLPQSGNFVPTASSQSEKPNDSSYRTPHWLQWRNHMANGTTTAASKNIICGAFHLYMNEIYGNKITVSIQWDHRKAWSDKDSSSPVNRSRNAKIPSRMRGDVLNVPSPKCLKDVQTLNGTLASLNSLPSTYGLDSIFLIGWFVMTNIFSGSLPVIRTILKASRAAARLRTSVKGQILTDFIIERLEDDSLDAPLEAKDELPDLWTLFTNGSSCRNGSRASLILKNMEGAEFTYALRFSFTNFFIKQVPRSENKKADALSKIASISFAHLTKHVLVEELKEKSINEAEVLAVVEEEGDTWMTPIYNFLMKETLLAEKEKARAVRRKSGRYVVIIEHACQKKIHGSKGHTNKIQLANDAHGYKKIDKGMSRLPDIARPFLEGPGKVKFLIATMDYFTKWIKAKLVATITETTHSKTDVKSYASTNALLIKHPQANGLVERVNRSLGEEIKARLDERSKDWIEEILHVLWAHRTMIKSSNGDTPFSLMYRMEAVIPTRIGMPTIRTAEVDIVQNDEALEINLDLLEEIREQEAIREAKSKAKIEKYYNSKVCNTSFKPRDLVYRSNEASHAKESRNLSPK
nr:reverse transcriptase domain-containing protein [Tanacetum cinerariifolium]